MVTKYRVTYRVHRLTKSGRKTRSVRRYRVRKRSFNTLQEANVFAAEHPDPAGQGFTKVEPYEVDTMLLADIFSIPIRRQK